LQGDLTEVTNLRTLQQSAAETLREGLSGVQRARTELSQAIADRTDLPMRFTEDPVRAAILISSTETLEGFASGLSEIAGDEKLNNLPPIDDLGAPTIGYTSSVSTFGIDKVFFGMTARTAQLAAGTRFTPITPMGECFLVTPDEAPDGITFWIVGGTIERVDIDTVEIGTRSGGRIGRTEDWIRHAWPDHIQASPLPDDSGNLLAFVPRDESDQEFRIMFQTDGEKVIRMWAGRLHWVAELGGCPVG
jgi:hypothetical protein